MKNVFFFLLLAATFSFVGCGDDDEDEVLADFMTATVNGDAFEATTVSGFSDDTGSEELLLTIGTRTSDGLSIGINLLSSIGTGEFQIDRNDLGFTFSEDLNNGTTAYFTEGTLNITRNDTTANVLEGSFNFTATDEDDATNIFNVTDGEFKVTYL